MSSCDVRICEGTALLSAMAWLSAWECLCRSEPDRMAEDRETEVLTGVDGSG